MCAGTPIWVGKHKSSSSQESGRCVGFFSSFPLFSLFREWERGLVRRHPIAGGAICCNTASSQSQARGAHGNDTVRVRRAL
jgi:hypothetical protein